MEATCQRCNETLREPDRYCPACGLPQLIFVEVDAGAEASAVAGSALGAGGSFAGAGRAGEIHWRQALKMALLVAVPAGVICSRMGLLDGLWIMLAAIWVVRLYARSTAPLQVTTSAGARIGLVTGLLAGWLVVAIDCGGLWIERYVLHQGGQIDSDFARAMEPALQLNQQMLAGLGNAGGEAGAAMQSMKALLFSPEGRAGMLLGGSLFSVAIIVFFAVVGGALGARLAPRLRRPEA